MIQAVTKINILVKYIKKYIIHVNLLKLHNMFYIREC